MFFALNILKRQRMTQVAAMLNTTAPIAQHAKNMAEKVTVDGPGGGLSSNIFTKRLMVNMARHMIIFPAIIT